jgi:eukaryotic-like serine/threonine-protein kinase
VPEDPFITTCISGAGTSGELVVKREVPAAGTEVVDGRYQVIQTLGEGGMGVVLLARDIGLDRLVALKLITPELAKSPRMAERFQLEARALASVRSPYVVQIHAFGPHADSFFFAMEYVCGPTLADILADHHDNGVGLPMQRVVDVVRQVSTGLNAVHAAGVTHGDVKPSNIVVEDDTGRPVLVDFGLATREAWKLAMAGTPAYMAPEQAEGDGEVTFRTDVYSLACTVFELLTGRPPFLAETQSEMMAKHARTTAPRISAIRPDLAVFDAVLARGLEKDPADRHPTCVALAEAVAGAASRLRPSRRPPSIPRMARVGSLQVLVVDDDAMFRKIAARAVEIALAGKRPNVVAVGSAHEALAQANQLPPDLVLLDFEMPAIDGVELLSELRALPHGNEARVVVMTTELGLRVSQFRFKILGVKDFVAKPFELEQLVALLESMARRSGWAGSIPAPDVG